MPSLKRLAELFDILGASYKAGKPDLATIPPIVEECYRILGANAKGQSYNDITRKIAGSTKKVVKHYSVFKDRSSVEISRPFRPALFISDYGEWKRKWDKMVAAIDRKNRTMDYAATDAVLYSASMAFFAVIDLFDRDARKRNGTFFEWLLGTLLHQVSSYPISAHIPILAHAEEGSENDREDAGSVPTDIVLDTGQGLHKLVFPAKISTRERINQIFTHQRILDVEFPGQYRGSLLCVSECQLLKKKGTVQETCVPTQVSFNEKYVAHIDALYYLDPPFPYIDDAIKVPVRRISDLFARDLAALSKTVEKEKTELCNAVISTVNCNLPKHEGGAHRYNPPRGSPIASASLSAADVAD